MRRLIVLPAVFFLFYGCMPKVAFVSEQTGKTQIHLMNTNGSSEEQLSNGRMEDRTPDPSPDGEEIVCSSLYNGEQNLFSVKISNGEVRQITTGTHPKYWPRWDSTKTKIAYSENVDSTWKIFTIKPGTTIAPVQITAPPAGQEDSGGHDFFHSGRQIVFSRYVRVRDIHRLYTKSADAGGNPTMVPNQTYNPIKPCISHDGRLLAYVSRFPQLANSRIDKIIVHKVGSWDVVAEITLKTPVKTWKPGAAGLAFSHDDKRLYVAAHSNDVSAAGNKDLEIFAITLDGIKQTRLTNNQVADYSPSAVPSKFWPF